MKKILIKALYRIVGQELDQVSLKTSGNILNLLRSVEEDIALKLADVYHVKKPSSDSEVFDVFHKGMNLAHTYKSKTSFYRIVLNQNVLYFTGTEAEILKEIQEELEKIEGKEKEKLKVD